MKTLSLIFVTLLASQSFAAGSSSKTCHSTGGDLVIVDGNMNVVDGIGEIGSPESQLILEELSNVTKNCVNGLPEYSQTVKTKEVVAHYQGEEPTHASLVLEVVICEEVRTGTSACN